MSLESINLVEFLLGLLFSLILPDPKEFNVWIRGILVFSLGVVLPYLCYQDPNSCMSLWPFNLFFDFFHQELQINDPYITLLFLSFLVSFLLGCFTLLYGFLHLISNQWQFFDYIHLALPVHITSLFGSSNQPVRKKLKAKKKKRRNLRVAIVIALWLCLMVVIFRQEIFNLISYLYLYLNSTTSSQVEPSQTTTPESSWSWIAFLDVLSISKDGNVVEEQIVEVGPAPKKKKKEKPVFDDDDDDDRIEEFDDYDWDEEDTEIEKMQAKKKIEEKTKKKQEKESKKTAKGADSTSRNQLVREQFLAWLKEHRKTHPLWTWLNPLQRPDAYYSLWIGSGTLSVLFCFCVWRIHKIQERQDLEARKANQQPANPNPNKNRKKTKDSGNLNNSNPHNNAGTNHNNQNNNLNGNKKDLVESSGIVKHASKKKRKKLSSSDGLLHPKPQNNKNYPL